MLSLLRCSEREGGGRKREEGDGLMFKSLLPPAGSVRPPEGRRDGGGEEAKRTKLEEEKPDLNLSDMKISSLASLFFIFIFFGGG